MITAGFAALSIWTATLLVVLMSLGFLRDAYVERRSAREEWEQARYVGNGRALIAEYNFKISFAFLAGAVVSLAVGAIGVWALVFLPPSPPDTRLSAAVLRFLFVVLIFFFWRAKRLRRVLRARLNVHDPTPMEERMDRLEAKQDVVSGKQDRDLRISERTEASVDRMEKRMEEDA